MSGYKRLFVGCWTGKNKLDQQRGKKERETGHKAPIPHHIALPHQSEDDSDVDDDDDGLILVQAITGLGKGDHQSGVEKELLRSVVRIPKPRKSWLNVSIRPSRQTSQLI